MRPEALISILILLLPMLLPGLAQGGCGRWVVRENYDYLGDPAFDVLGGLSNEILDEADLLTDADPTRAADALETEVERAPGDPGDGVFEGGQAAGRAATDVSGQWSVKLNDTAVRYLDLILFQSGFAVQGYGDLADGEKDLPVTAMGSVSEEAVSLTVKLVVNEYVNSLDRRYEMDLALINETLSGGYLVYGEGDLLGTGNATANRPGP